MATLQIKNMPDELHRKLKERAQSRHMSMADYATQVLLTDLQYWPLAEWAEATEKLVGPTVEGLDSVAALDAARSEYADEGPGNR
jgi:hypothetical protein